MTMQIRVIQGTTPLALLLTVPLSLAASEATQTQQWSQGYQLPKAQPPTNVPKTQNWSEGYQLPKAQAPATVPEIQNWSEDYRIPQPSRWEMPGPGAEYEAKEKARRVAQARHLCQQGQPVKSFFMGTWYAAKVLQGPDQEGNCQISYDGYGTNWHEWAPIDRLLPAELPRNTPGATHIPAGKYPCYTLDAGLLNYTYSDIIIEPGNRYVFDKQHGTYQMKPDGFVTFSAPMAQVRAKVSVSDGGVTALDLFFNNRAISDMSCTKGR